MINHHQNLNIMKTTTFIISVCSLIVYGFSNCTATSSKPLEQDSIRDSVQLTKRGEYLVNTMGCDDCHSPKKMGLHGPEVDIALRFSGYPSERPMQPAEEEALKSG